MTNSAEPDQKPTDLDLHCLQMQGISPFSRTRVNVYLFKTRNAENFSMYLVLTQTIFECGNSFPYYSSTELKLARNICSRCPQTLTKDRVLTCGHLHHYFSKLLRLENSPYHVLSSQQPLCSLKHSSCRH